MRQILQLIFLILVWQNQENAVRDFWEGILAAVL